MKLIIFMSRCNAGGGGVGGREMFTVTKFLADLLAVLSSGDATRYKALFDLHACKSRQLTSITFPTENNCSRLTETFPNLL